MRKLSEKQPFIHPYTAFLVRNLQDIYDTIKAGVLTGATKKIYYFIKFLEPDIKKNLAKEIKFMEDSFQNVRLLTEERFNRLLDGLLDELHKAGYFEAAKGWPTFERETRRQ